MIDTLVRWWRRFWCPYTRSGPDGFGPWTSEPYCTCGEHGE